MNPSDTVLRISPSPLAPTAFGAAIGLMSGFFGTGGGWIVTPALHIPGLPASEAAGTSLVSLLVTSGFGAPPHGKLANVDTSLALAAGASLALSALVGKRLVLHLESSGGGNDSGADVRTSPQP